MPARFLYNLIAKMNKKLAIVSIWLMSGVVTLALIVLVILAEMYLQEVGNFTWLIFPIGYIFFSVAAFVPSVFSRKLIILLSYLGLLIVILIYVTKFDWISYKKKMELESFAWSVIHKIEAYKLKTGKFPSELEEIGVDAKAHHLFNYSTSDGRIFLEYYIYNSKNSYLYSDDQRRFVWGD